MDIISELRNPSVIARPFGVKVIMYVYADAHTICDCGKELKLTRRGWGNRTYTGTCSCGRSTTLLDGMIS